jgi:hypothetical protein
MSFNIIIYSKIFKSTFASRFGTKILSKFKGKIFPKTFSDEIKFHKIDPWQWRPILASPLNFRSLVSLVSALDYNVMADQHLLPGCNKDKTVQLGATSKLSIF